MNALPAFPLHVPANSLSSTPLSEANASGTAHGQRLTLDEVSRLEALLRDVEDCSSLSPELMKRAIMLNLWYHVTPFRSSIVRSLELPPAARILEVGCGAGALTRYLGESGFQVVSIETSEALAECARLRCADLQNVEIINGFLEDVLLDQKFDFVICIDPFFANSDFLDPGIQLFALTRKVLKATGTLILSVGNSLHSPGGAHVEPSQQHVRGSAAPLEALTRSLEGVGFANIERYATFPHHAAPQLIVDVEKARADRIGWLQLLKEMFSASEQAERDMESWWKGVSLEGLEAQLAPGWLVLAHAHTVHSLLWDGKAAQYFVPRDTGQTVEGVGVTSLDIARHDVVEAILQASKPTTNSVKDYKKSLVAADNKIDELAFKESLLSGQLKDVRDELVFTQERHASEIVSERESRRIREAELGLVLKQYHAVGAMCHDMREEGRKLKEMLDELKRRYIASEEWGTALSKRIAEAEAELQQAKSSRAYRLAQKIKSFIFRSNSPDITSTVKASLKPDERQVQGIL